MSSKTKVQKRLKYVPYSRDTDFGGPGLYEDMVTGFHYQAQTLEGAESRLSEEIRSVRETLPQHHLADGSFRKRFILFTEPSYSNQKIGNVYYDFKEDAYVLEADARAIFCGEKPSGKRIELKFVVK